MQSSMLPLLNAQSNLGSALGGSDVARKLDTGLGGAPMRPLGAGASGNAAGNSHDSLSSEASQVHSAAGGSGTPGAGHGGVDGSKVAALVVEAMERSMRRVWEGLGAKLENTSARLEALEGTVAGLKTAVLADLKAGIADGMGSVEGRLRQVENLVREVWEPTTCKVSIGSTTPTLLPELLCGGQLSTDAFYCD